MNHDCDRAREWASAGIDGELSAFESALLEAHLAGCPPCRNFQSAAAGASAALRTASLERFELPVATGSNHRRRLYGRLAPAAAVAVAVIGVAGILTSAQLRHFDGRDTPAPASVQRNAAINLLKVAGTQREAILKQRAELRLPRGAVGR